MPELPEVETIARGLAKRVTGDVVESVWLGQKKEPLKSPASEVPALHREAERDTTGNFSRQHYLHTWIGPPVQGRSPHGHTLPFSGYSV